MQCDLDITHTYLRLAKQILVLPVCEVLVRRIIVRTYQYVTW